MIIIIKIFVFIYRMSLIDKLSKEQIADFREAFSLFDHDENGSISHVELGQVLNALGQTPS